VNLSGLTIKEAEAFLEEKYAKYYIDPFARIMITNRRITVFSGDYSQGEVVAMENRNLRLIEALALSGGIPRSGKAHNIKIFRGDPQNPEIYHFDLSKIEDFEYGGFVLQSNDVVYVEPRISLSSEILREWAPILTMITSVLTLYILINNIK
jgi:polysaccharide export outer membrane protein